MKKYNAISLIETLISLAIVSIALIALLPVVTVKKDAVDLTKGNSMWTTTSTGTVPADMCRVNNTDNQQCPVEIGDKILTPNEKFTINANGLNNDALVPLNVKGRFSLHGMNIESSAANESADNQFFHAFAGASTTFESNTRPGRWVLNPETGYYVLTSFDSNIYYDAKKVIIKNDDAYDANFALNFRQEGTTGYPLRYEPQRTTPTNYVSLGNQRNEYIYADNTNANNVVSIGMNSGKSPGASSGTTNLVSIFNAQKASEADFAISSGNFNGILIGAKTDNSSDNMKYNNPDKKFAIVKYNGTNLFHFYAANTSVQGLYVNAILIPSDKRLKNIMGKYKKGLKEILKIKPVEFTLKSDKEKTLHVGVIAQDLMKIFPNSVLKNKQGYFMVSEEETFYALLNSIKELNNKNQKIAEDNKKLKAKIAQLQQIRNELRASKGGNHE